MPRKTGRSVCPGVRRNYASMRPRPDAAENVRVGHRDRAALVASMRPRPDAAENPLTYGVVWKIVLGFNEAAARCRGKQGTRPRRRILPQPPLQ